MVQAFVQPIYDDGSRISHTLPGELLQGLDNEVFELVGEWMVEYVWIVLNRSGDERTSFGYEKTDFVGEGWDD